MLLGLLLPAGVAAGQTISEIRIEDPGTPADTDEYFEIAGTPSTSLSDLTYIVIGDGIGGHGVLEVVVSLSGQTIPGDGYFLAAESGFTLGGSVDLTTDLSFESADNVTHLLVRDFSGQDNTDLDTDNDGVLDLTPWSEIVDCVALMDRIVGGDLTYCATRVGPNQGSVPSHVYLDGGWQMGTFDPAQGSDTPGVANSVLPVELAAFEARVDGDSVTLLWTTASETNNAGFAIEHRATAEYEELAFVAGQGTTADETHYSHTTSGLSPGKHVFRLRQTDLGGLVSYSSAIEVLLEQTDTYLLSSAYPNPFNPMTSVELSVRETQMITAEAFDMLGRRVALMHRGIVEAGETRQLRFSAEHLSTGFYTIRITGQSFADSRQVILLK